MKIRILTVGMYNDELLSTNTNLYYTLEEAKKAIENCRKCEVLSLGLDKIDEDEPYGTTTYTTDEKYQDYDQLVVKKDGLSFRGCAEYGKRFRVGEIKEFDIL